MQLQAGAWTNSCGAWWRSVREGADIDWLRSLSVPAEVVRVVANRARRLQSQQKTTAATLRVKNTIRNSDATALSVQNTNGRCAPHHQRQNSGVQFSETKKIPVGTVSETAGMMSPNTTFEIGYQVPKGKLEQPLRIMFPMKTPWSHPNALCNPNTPRACCNRNAEGANG